MYYPTSDEIRHLRDAEMSSHTHAAKCGRDLKGITPRLHYASLVANERRPLLPLYRDVLCDLETPVSAYCKTAKGPYSFLLESVTGGGRGGRPSFFGLESYMIIFPYGEKATRYSLPGR